MAIITVIPLGTIIAYSGPLSATNPVWVDLQANGWELCDGGDLDRTTYNDLFGIIGTTWGEGDGINTFNLPDLRGQFIRGLDPQNHLDPDGDYRHNKYTGGNTGNFVGTYQYTATKIPNSNFVLSVDGLHSHILDHAPTTHRKSSVASTGNDVSIWSVGQYTEPDGEHTHIISGGDNESRPPNANVNFLIKARNIPTSGYVTNLLTGTTTIDSFEMTLGHSCTWEMTIYNDTESIFQELNVNMLWGTILPYVENMTQQTINNIGTTDVTIDAYINGTLIWCEATMTSDGWNIRWNRSVK